jgi:LPS export ABC transporter protein LptC/lipopolysaccharide transport protein LptA
MALQGSELVVRRPVLTRAADDAAARVRVFGQARRHTFIVKTLRRALPVIALAALTSYGVGMRFTMSLGGGKLDTGKIAISTENLTMSNPRYEGFNKDGSKYVVTAKTAVQDIRQQGPIDLNIIEGVLTQANGVVIKLTAPRGKFNNKDNQLDLYDDIKIRGTDGTRADLTQATVYIKENRIVSTEPVAIDMTAGQIRANEMDLRQAAKQVTFANGVVTRLKVEAKPVEVAAKPVAAGGLRPLGAGDGPVDVSSHTLNVDDAKKTAIFTGDVVAKQGDATLRAPTLQVVYDGTPLPPPGGGPTTAVAPAGVPAGKLKRILVPADVVLTQGADRVTSDKAEFDAERETAILLGRVSMSQGADRRATSDRVDLDQRNDLALLTGNVVVTQERNVLQGGRLAIDRKAGTTKLSTPAEPGQPVGRIAARFIQAATAPTGKPAPKAATPDGEAGGFVFRTDPNAPIDIDSETLDVLDKAKTATFRGAVHAVQGEFVMRTLELVVTYSGEAGLASAATSVAGKQPSAQLTRIRANQKVEVTSTNGQSATGDWADFDVKANTVTLGGNVALKKGQSLVYAPKAVIDMTTGVTYLERETRPVGPSVSFSPTAQRAPYTLPDLPAVKPAVVAPTPPAFATNPAACPTGQSCAVFNPQDSDAPKDGKKPGLKPTAPWQTGTAGAAKPKPPATSATGWPATPGAAGWPAAPGAPGWPSAPAN